MAETCLNNNYEGNKLASFGTRAILCTYCFMYKTHAVHITQYNASLNGTANWCCWYRSTRARLAPTEFHGDALTDIGTCESCRDLKQPTDRGESGSLRNHYRLTSWDSVTLRFPLLANLLTEYILIPAVRPTQHTQANWRGGDSLSSSTEGQASRHHGCTVPDSFAQHESWEFSLFQS